MCGQDHLLPQGHKLNNFGRGPLGDTSLNTKSLCFVVKKISFHNVKGIHVTLVVELFLATEP